jgi:hypothetical protein
MFSVKFPSVKLCPWTLDMREGNCEISKLDQSHQRCEVPGDHHYGIFAFNFPAVS